jgi:hypothetical protein
MAEEYKEEEFPIQSEDNYKLNFAKFYTEDNITLIDSDRLGINLANLASLLNENICDSEIIDSGISEFISEKVQKNIDDKLDMLTTLNVTDLLPIETFRRCIDILNYRDTSYYITYENELSKIIDYFSSDIDNTDINNTYLLYKNINNDSGVGMGIGMGIQSEEDRTLKQEPVSFVSPERPKVPEGIVRATSSEQIKTFPAIEQRSILQEEELLGGMNSNNEPKSSKRPFGEIGNNNDEVSSGRNTPIVNMENREILDDIENLKSFIEKKIEQKYTSDLNYSDIFKYILAYLELEQNSEDIYSIHQTTFEVPYTLKYPSYQPHINTVSKELPNRLEESFEQGSNQGSEESFEEGSNEGLEESFEVPPYNSVSQEELPNRFEEGSKKGSESNFEILGKTSKIEKYQNYVSLYILFSNLYPNIMAVIDSKRLNISNKFLLIDKIKIALNSALIETQWITPESIINHFLSDLKENTSYQLGSFDRTPIRSRAETPENPILSSNAPVISPTITMTTGGSCEYIEYRNELLYIKFLFEWSHDFGPARAQNYITAYSKSTLEKPNFYESEGIFHKIEEGWENIIRDVNINKEGNTEHKLDIELFEKLSLTTKHNESNYISSIIDTLILFCDFKEDYFYIPIIEIKYTSDNGIENMTKFFNEVFKYFNRQRMFIKEKDTVDELHLFITSDVTPTRDIKNSDISYTMRDMNLEEITIALATQRESLYTAWEENIGEYTQINEEFVKQIFGKFKKTTGEIISEANNQNHILKTPARLIDPINNSSELVEKIDGNWVITTQISPELKSSYNYFLNFSTIYGINQLLNVWIDNKKVINRYELKIEEDIKTYGIKFYKEDNLNLSSVPMLEWDVGDTNVNTITGALINLQYLFQNESQQFVDLLQQPENSLEQTKQKFNDIINLLTSTDFFSNIDIQEKCRRIYKNALNIILDSQFKFMDNKVQLPTLFMMIIAYLKSCGDEFQRLTCESMNYFILSKNIEKIKEYVNIPENNPEINPVNMGVVNSVISQVDEPLPMENNEESILNTYNANLEKFKEMKNIFFLTKDRILIAESLEKDTPVFTYLQSPHPAFSEKTNSEFPEDQLDSDSSLKLFRRTMGTLSNRSQLITTSNIDYGQKLTNISEMCKKTVANIFFKLELGDEREIVKLAYKMFSDIYPKSEQDSVDEIKIKRAKKQLSDLSIILLPLEYYTPDVSGINKLLYESCINAEISKAFSMTINSEMMNKIKNEYLLQIPNTKTAISDMIKKLYDEPNIVDKLLETWDKANDMVIQKIESYKDMLNKLTNVKVKFKNPEASTNPEAMDTAELELAVASEPINVQASTNPEDMEIAKGEEEEEEAREPTNLPASTNQEAMDITEGAVTTGALTEEEVATQIDEEDLKPINLPDSTNPYNDNDFFTNIDIDLYIKFKTKIETEVILFYTNYITYIKTNKNAFTDKFLSTLESELQAEINKSARKRSSSSDSSYADVDEEKEQLERISVELELKTRELQEAQVELEEAEDLMKEVQESKKKTKKDLMTSMFNAIKSMVTPKEAKSKVNEANKNISNLSKLIQKLTSSATNMQRKIANKTKRIGIESYQSMVSMLRRRKEHSRNIYQGGRKMTKKRIIAKKHCNTKNQRVYNNKTKIKKSFKKMKKTRK